MVKAVVSWVRGFGARGGRLGVVFALWATLAACGDDGDAPTDDMPMGPVGGGGDMPGDPNGQPGPSPAPAPAPGADGLQICYDLCAAQDAAEMAGNCVALGLSACQGICDASQGGRCSSELNALSACQLTGTFSCGFFSAESDADCDTEVTAYNSCVF